MRVLVACEFSGVVRDAFLSHGHDATSCDLLPSETPGPHYTGDVRDLLDDDWDMVIAHPPCTYLANSGVRWLHEEKGRWEKMEEGAAFFRLFFGCAPMVAIENPRIHGHAKRLIGRGPDHVIQPWEFGHPETKAVCLWLENLPPLMPTCVTEGREPRVHRMTPGPDRWKERSRFFTGIAEAMADQWGCLTPSASPHADSKAGRTY